MDKKQTKEEVAKQKNINALKDEKIDKKCFIITPIGDENSEIRRHINGVIDAAIKPILEGRYEVKAAHHIDLPGNITKQIIKELYESDLVIANLTDRNPNVMYELALRHCFGNPTIIIAEETTGLPADIISERTIFYRNDAQGVLELKNKLSSAVEDIENVDAADKETMGPVYDNLAGIIQDNKIIENAKINDSSNAEVLSLLLERIDKLSKNVNQNNVLMENHSPENFVPEPKLGQTIDCPEDLQQNFAQAISAIYHDSGNTITEFAKELGISRTSLQEILDGTGNPRMDTIQHIAMRLGVNPFELLLPSNIRK